MKKAVLFGMALAIAGFASGDVSAATADPDLEPVPCCRYTKCPPRCPLIETTKEVNQTVIIVDEKIEQTQPKELK